MQIQSHADSNRASEDSRHLEPRRILHLIDTTGPGGAETVYVSLADFTRRRGAESLALIRGDGWVKSQLQAAGIRTLTANSKGSFNLKFLTTLIRVIRNEEIDLVQAHLLGSNVYACLAGLLTGVPVVCTFHGNVDIAARERLAWAKFLLIRLGARKVIVVSDQLRRSIARHVSDSRLAVIHNGVDLDDFSRPRSRLRTDGRTIRIGALGNIRPAKDYFNAVRAVRVLKDRGYSVRLEIAGGGRPGLLKEVESEIHKLDLTANVDLLGFISNVPDFLANLDVYVLSSKSEGHPLALIQAMAMGLPIVATRCGVEEILGHERDSLLVPTGEPEALADAVARMIREPELADDLAQRALDLVRQKYSVEAMHRSYWNAYCS